MADPEGRRRGARAALRPRGALRGRIRIGRRSLPAGREVAGGPGEGGKEMSREPAILTTVVCSYPVPSWLLAQPSEGNRRDAVMVVLKAQELAGIDVVSDGEL